ncbi:hypothetical protein [Streptomyces sp. NPDC058739]|uniref:hypothetical protein n=1 Tax=Streptomyces sp. NPDC058739 TaxID=3346618 RepID=UPI0036AF3167
MSSPTDDLYARYMAAYRAYTDHAETCTACTVQDPGTSCRGGLRLHESFARLQDAYNARLRKQGSS